MQQTNSQSVVEEGATTPAAQLSSEELFRKGNTVRIEHAGQTYWLRLTRGNKLILTK